MFLATWYALLLTSLLNCLYCGTAISFTRSDKASFQGTPKVGLSISVHPPKFSYVVRFLQQFAKCPAARKNMFVNVVFSDQNDWNVFQEGLALFKKDIPSDSFVPVIANVPKHFNYLMQSQNICAWKKFYGLAHMMDMNDPPEYGIITDSEMLLFNESDCFTNSKWNSLYDRIKLRHDKKQWPAQQIDYNRKYDWNYLKRVMGAVETWVNKGDNWACLKPKRNPNCDHLEMFHHNVTFSWWTDMPWVNLKSVANMLTYVSGQKKEAHQNWTQMVYPMNFSRYDHIAYQYYTVLHENFTFVNVTNITGKTYTMSTYTEAENRNGSRIASLYPMWVGDKVLRQTKQSNRMKFTDSDPVWYAQIDPFSKDFPPLLVFHTDLAARKILEPDRLWTNSVNASRKKKGIEPLPPIDMSRIEPKPKKNQTVPQKNVTK